MTANTSKIDNTDSGFKTTLDRRGFIGGAITLAASSFGIFSSFAAGGQPQKTESAEPKRKIKIGIVGCGGRGHWITEFFQKHGGFEFIGVADYFEDLANRTGEALGVDKARRFSGLSGYKKLIDCGIEALVIEDVPYFYPEQAKAAVDAGCHVYMAKPIAVDAPGCLTIEAAAKKATEKQRCFLVDFQIPRDPANIEVANRVREGAVGPIAHIISYGNAGPYVDPPHGPTIEDRIGHQKWYSDIALSGDCMMLFDIHIVDGITWMTGKRAISACGRSRICRPEPHGDRIDVCSVVYEYDDGTIWTHLLQSLKNNYDYTPLSASIFGMNATAHFGYWEKKVYVRGGEKHYVGNNSGGIYGEGVQCNVADFYKNITEGHFENTIAKRAVDSHLTGILGREAAARGRYMTMDELIKENIKRKIDLTGLKT